jgi:glycosyltransferase involved in cell wall biosynthesis
MSAVAVVVIGRNEGERLQRCLQSVLRLGFFVVYVDSGSADGSVAAAKALGCEVIELDRAQPFTAARARNEGVAWLGRHRPEVQTVQLLDGDTELCAGWVEKGVAALESREDVCAVFGRLNERHPEASVYNRICDLEWKLPAGEVHCFGGILLLRKKAFLDSGGFNAGLIAGEEPELSQRLRRAGWRILSLDVDMALHDADITRFRQWWKRSLRSGHAYAQVCWMGSGIRDRFGLKQSLRTWFWVFVVPCLAGLSVLFHRAAPLAFVGLYLLQSVRVGLGRRFSGVPGAAALGYGLLWLPTQLAQWVGQCKFAFNLLLGRSPHLIEYKTGGREAP